MEHVQVFTTTYNLGISKWQPNIPNEYFIRSGTSDDDGDDGDDDGDDDDDDDLSMIDCTLGPYTEKYIFENRHLFDIPSLIRNNCIPTPGLLEFLCRRANPPIDPFEYVERNRLVVADWLIYFARPRHMPIIRSDIRLWNIYKRSRERKSPEKLNIVRGLPHLAFMAARAVPQYEDMTQMTFITAVDVNRYIIKDTWLNASLVRKYQDDIDLDYVWKFCTLSEDQVHLQVRLYLQQVLVKTA